MVDPTKYTVPQAIRTLDQTSKIVEESKKLDIKKQGEIYHSGNSPFKKFK